MDNGNAVPDSADSQAQLRAEILSALRAPQPALPCKLFYDEQGSQIYEQITALSEYYPYAAEVDILTQRAKAIADIVGSDVWVVEYGSGSSVKTRLLLDHLHAPAGYVPIDISREHLVNAAQALAESYPDLRIQPLNADFTAEVVLPESLSDAHPRVAFFPGSTIGNFDPDGAIAFMSRIRRVVGDDGWLLIGVDVPKDKATFELAYDDPQGVTARFNLNILNHVNRLLDGDFDLTLFAHEALWNAEQSRIEMHLLCLQDHEVRLAGTTLSFESGETIWTESSYKYPPGFFKELAAAAGFAPAEMWFDDARRYTVHLLRAKAES